jgi:hypothetical protein
MNLPQMNLPQKNLGESAVIPVGMAATRNPPVESERLPRKLVQDLRMLPKRGMKLCCLEPSASPFNTPSHF